MAYRFTDSVEGKKNADKVEQALKYLSLNEDNKLFERPISPTSDNSEIHDPFDEDEEEIDAAAMAQQINKRVNCDFGVNELHLII